MNFRRYDIDYANKLDKKTKAWLKKFMIDNGFAYHNFDNIKKRDIWRKFKRTIPKGDKNG